MRKLLLVPLLALGLAAAAPAGADDFTATITPNGFPPLISIQNGDRVVWKNGDTVSRQLVADDSSWKSPVIKPGDTWSHIFRNGGTFRYHGAVKPSQHGAIEVSSSRAVLIQRGASTITFAHSLLLKGSVSKPSSSGEEVVIQAEPYGTSSFDTVARTTTDNGFWQVRVQPSRTTVYRAIWKNVPSTDRTVFVKPLVRIKQLSRRHFSIGVRADVSLVHRIVVIQRLNRARHVWRSFASVRLSHFQSTATAYNSIASVRLALRHGTIIRALITRHQAAPNMRGPAWSRALRV
jgi:plastocyanin